MKITKIKILEFNVLVTLAVIEANEDLLSIFKEDVPMSFNLVKDMAAKGEVTDNINKNLVSIFEELILTRIDYVNSYTDSAKQLDIPIKDSTPEPEKPKEVVEEKPKVTREVKQIPKNLKIPRRYGISLIQKDIHEQGGNPTPQQKAMIALNELSNVSINLTTKSIRDLFSDTEYINDVDARMIVTLVEMVKQKTKHILKDRKHRL